MAEKRKPKQKAKKFGGRRRIEGLLREPNGRISRRKPITSSRECEFVCFGNLIIKTKSIRKNIHDTAGRPLQIKITMPALNFMKGYDDGHERS